MADSGFVKGSQITYVWKEGWSTLGKQDTAFLPRSIQITNLGDTQLIADTVLRLRLRITATDGYPLPGSVATHLGFNPARLLLDSAAVPDPGPALDFPLTPQIGWRDTLTSGELHFVRELTGLDTISWHGSRLENWVFSDTTYWNGTVMETALYSMSRNGLLQLSEQRPGFNADGDTTTRVLWLQVTAQ